MTEDVGSGFEARGASTARDAPRLVVLLPTRNRSDLALISIRSLLRVDSSIDLQVMVSDNSTDPAETQRLAEVVREANDPRLQLVRPPRPLPMSGHWNWLVGQGLATGATHLAVLTDRMCFRPGGLEAVWALARTHPGDVVSYSYDRLYDNRQPAVLALLPRSGHAFRLDAAQVLVRASRMIFGSSLPRLLNCIVPRSRLLEIADRHGDFVGSVAPDYCFCFRLLDCVDSILYLDSSVMINHAQARSTGGSMSRGIHTRDSQDFFRNHGGRPVNGNCPIPELMTVGNAVVDEYLEIMKGSRTGRFVAIELPDYYRMLATEIEAFESDGARAEATKVLVSKSGYREKRSLAASVRRFVSALALAMLSKTMVANGEVVERAARVPARRWPVMGLLQRQDGKTRLRR